MCLINACAVSSVNVGYPPCHLSPPNGTTASKIEIVEEILPDFSLYIYGSKSLALSFFASYPLLTQIIMIVVGRGKETIDH